ncbi:MAG: ankyrin repeat domain-containing protein [Wolbachia sp.]
MVRYSKVSCRRKNSQSQCYEHLWRDTSAYGCFGSLDVVKYFEKRGIDINIKDRYGNSLLHYTAGGGELDIVRYLIEKEKIDFNIKNLDEVTPLHIAAFSRNLDVVRYLIEEKC